jgi:hypothetical protein
LRLQGCRVRSSSSVVPFFLVDLLLHHPCVRRSPSHLSCLNPRRFTADCNCLYSLPPSQALYVKASVDEPATLCGNLVLRS